MHCLLIVHLFVSYAHVNQCHVFSSSWCRELAAASACGSTWTFLFTFFSEPVKIILEKNHSADISICLSVTKVQLT